MKSLAGLACRLLWQYLVLLTYARRGRARIHYSTAAVSCLSLALIVGCESRPTSDTSSSVPINEITESLGGTGHKFYRVEDVIEIARTAPVAGIFVECDWSYMSVILKKRFVQYVWDYHSDNPDSRVYFYNLDLTACDSNYLQTIPGWLDQVARRGNNIKGEGEILWIVNGRVAQLDRSLMDYESFEQFRVTALKFADQTASPTDNTGIRIQTPVAPAK